MRTGRWLAALLLAAGLAGPARAQRAFTWGGNNAPIQYQIAGGNGPVPIAQPQVLNTKWSLTSFFHTPTPISNHRVIGRSSFPSRAEMPGKDYLRAFGFRRGQP